MMQVTGPAPPDCFMWPYTCDPMDLVLTGGITLMIVALAALVIFVRSRYGGKDDG